MSSPSTGTSPIEVRDVGVSATEAHDVGTGMTEAAENACKMVARRPRVFVCYIADVISTSAFLLKWPIACLVALTVAVFLALGAKTFVMHALRSSLPSPCDLPAFAHLSLCNVATSTHETSVIERADFPSLIKIQNVVLDDLMDQVATGANLALNVKHAELAVRDLVVVVRSSNLSVRAELADALSEFSADARMAARGLQRLSARVNGAVDGITSFNAYAFQHLSSQRGSPGEVGTMVLRTFRSSMNGFSTHITRVLVEAATTMASLDLLEDRLSGIHQLYVHESFETTLALDTLLWELWTILGGNQEKLRDLRSRAVILKDVERYRAVAVAYVAATSQTLLAVDAELSELRDRLTGYVVDAQDIPVEVHLASIERGISRLHDKFQTRGGIDPA